MGIEFQQFNVLHFFTLTFQCDKCGKQFVHYSSFHMHQLAHNNIREKKCDICGLELLSSSHLSRHMRVHTGEKVIMLTCIAHKQFLNDEFSFSIRSRTSARFVINGSPNGS